MDKMSCYTHFAHKKQKKRNAKALRFKTSPKNQQGRYALNAYNTPFRFYKSKTLSFCLRD